MECRKRRAVSDRPLFGLSSDFYTFLDKEPFRELFRTFGERFALQAAKINGIGLSEAEEIRSVKL